nr:MAG TPA: hypothetical protein [Caudoviricetes sp.]
MNKSKYVLIWHILSLQIRCNLSLQHNKPATGKMFLIFPIRTALQFQLYIRRCTHVFCLHSIQLLVF